MKVKFKHNGKSVVVNFNVHPNSKTNFSVMNSVYRSGFEVRSYRRCRRVLMFHRFAELGQEPCLVQSNEFEYDDLIDFEAGVPPSVDKELEHQLFGWFRGVDPDVNEEAVAVADGELA